MVRPCSAACTGHTWHCRKDKMIWDNAEKAALIQAAAGGIPKESTTGEITITFSYYFSSLPQFTRNNSLRLLYRFKRTNQWKKSTGFLKPMDILLSFLTASGYCILLKLWQLKQTRNRAAIPPVSNREVLVESSPVTPAIPQPQLPTCCNTYLILASIWLGKQPLFSHL